jgi:mRNA-degrading endonuclease RelE of RelBE toxin-antitoxin system
MPPAKADFSIEFLPGAARDLTDVSDDVRDRLLDVIDRELSRNPFPRATLIKRLHGFRVPTYELRIRRGTGSYRVVYRIEGRRVLILLIPPRRELERHMRRLK